MREALAAQSCVVEIFATHDATRRHADLVQTCRQRGVPWLLASAAAMGALSGTVSPQGVVAVCEFIDQPLETVLGSVPSLVALCAAIRDPGNAGTVIRTADAAGAGAVIFVGDSVDPYNGKAVRASVGSLFHLPVVIGVALEDTVTAVRAAGLQVLAAAGSGALTLGEANDGGLLDQSTAWLFGNEAWGMPEADLALADNVVRVPIYGRAESLNLATAVALCLYASASAHRRR